MNATLPLHLQRPEPEKWLSAALAVLVHAILAALLVLGVRWQTHTLEAVEVELVSAVPTMPQRAVTPVPEPKPLPKVEPPPKPEPKPEPKPVVKEPPPPPKPDIARKEPEKKKPEPLPKVPEKPVVKPAPQRDWSKELSAAEQNLSRQKATDAAAKELQEIKAAQESSRNRAVESWVGKIRGAIRRHTVVPPGVTGDPEAVFDVSILPDGTVFSVKLKKSTGFPSLDAAVERAIQKASPLPKPDDPKVFSRELKITHWPLRD